MRTQLLLCDLGFNCTNTLTLVISRDKTTYVGVETVQRTEHTAQPLDCACRGRLINAPGRAK